MSMRELSQAQVVAEVTFKKLLTGAQITTLVELVAGDAFISLQMYSQGGPAFIIGQRGKPSDHLMVVPNLDKIVFGAYSKYSSVRVATSYWKGYYDHTKVVPVGYDYKAENAAVEKFAAELRRLVGRPTE